MMPKTIKLPLIVKPFLLVLLLACGLRFTALTFESLWLDESYQTVVESYGNNLPNLLNPAAKAFIYKPDKPAMVNTVLEKFRQVDPLCPPIFAVLMNRWLTVFGGSDNSLRIFPALFSILSIIATYAFGYLLLGKHAALYAALLQTISPFDIAYAQEVRMYSLCTFFAMLSGGSLLYLCLHKKSSKSILLATVYIISTWALINTHYTQIFFWAFAIIIALGISLLHRDLSLLATTIITNLSVIALSLPWLPLFIQAASIRTASFYVARQATLFWPISALLIRIPFNWIVFLSGKKVMFWAFPLYLTAFIILGSSLFFVFKSLKTGHNQDNHNLIKETPKLNYTPLLLLLWAIFPALCIWGVDIIELHRVIEIPRYLISTAPAIYLLAGYGLAKLTRNFFTLLILAHTIFCLTNNAYLHIIPQKENWRQVAVFLEKVCQPEDIIFVSNYYNILCLDRYLHRPFRQVGISTTNAYTAIENTLKTSAANKNTTTFWILSAQEGDVVFNTLPANYTIVASYDFPHALHLKQYKAKIN